MIQKKIKTLAVLGYHKIGEPPAEWWGDWYYISEEIFAGQLECLRKNNWQVIDVNTLLAGLDSPEILPERAALLTFDDGYRSFCSAALRELREFGYPAVLFVPTDYIGKWNEFDADTEPEERICGWDDLRELERMGISVQSHGASHRAFSVLDARELETELKKSKAVLERELGKPVHVFSFPYGDGGRNLSLTGQQLRRAGYRAACLYGGGPNVVPISDPFRLTRLAMGPDTDLDSELMRVEDEFRKTMA